MRFTAQQGRLSIHLRVFRQGRDLQVLCGRGATHIGAVALAAPAHGQVEAQSHLAGLPGHKEDALALHMAERMAHLAPYDALTDLPNRALFTRRVQQALSGRRATDRGAALRGTAVLFIDLDGFKAVNDGFGHAAGDETLKEISQRLLTQVRAGDVLARLGGDEFGIVMRDGPTEAAQALARRIVRAVSQPIRLSTGDEVGVGVSVGMAAYANDVMSVRKLVTQADQALYEAKKQNERRWKMFVGLRA